APRSHHPDTSLNRKPRRYLDRTCDAPLREDTVRDGNPVLLVGRGQAVRHETLDLASAASNPPAPAISGPVTPAIMRESGASAEAAARHERSARRVPPTLRSGPRSRGPCAST